MTVEEKVDEELDDEQEINTIRNKKRAADSRVRIGVWFVKS
ncbi:MAG: hypothetical protein WD607_07480 [Candidatus Paceibacterota bacterium]